LSAEWKVLVVFLCTLLNSRKAHNGSVWKVAWAHPEFGMGVLASASFDRTVCIWEETGTY
jgi:hypothetical protein